MRVEESERREREKEREIGKGLKERASRFHVKVPIGMPSLERAGVDYTQVHLCPSSLTTTTTTTATSITPDARRTTTTRDEPKGALLYIPQQVYFFSSLVSRHRCAGNIIIRGIRELPTYLPTYPPTNLKQQQQQQVCQTMRRYAMRARIIFQTSEICNLYIRALTSTKRESPEQMNEALEAQPNNNTPTRTFHSQVALFLS